MQLAQVNIAQLKAPLESDRIKEFRDFLDPVNRLAEESPGFVWRLSENFGAGNPKPDSPFGDEMLLINLSVWTDIESLRTFSYRTVHRYFVRSRSKWFHQLGHPHLAMWWVEDGHRPTLEEAKRKLEAIEDGGPSPEVFNFHTSFTAEESAP